MKLNPQRQCNEGAFNGSVSEMKMNTKRSNRLSNYILYVWRSAVFSFILWFTQDSITASYFFHVHRVIWMRANERRKVLFCFSSLVFPNRFDRFFSLFFWILCCFLFDALITVCFVSRTNAFVAFGIQWNPTFHIIIIVFVWDVSSVQLLYED